MKKIKNSLRKEFDGETVYNEKYLNTKINVYNRKRKTNFHIIKYQKKVFNSLFASNFNRFCI